MRKCKTDAMRRIRWHQGHSGAVGAAAAHPGVLLHDEWPAWRRRLMPAPAPPGWRHL